MQILTGCQRYCLYNKIMMESQTFNPNMTCDHIRTGVQRIHQNAHPHTHMYLYNLFLHPPPHHHRVCSQL